MSREDERNRLFSEQVDRILTGGPAAVPGGADDDFRTALDFARDIAAMTPGPRAGFATALGGRLRTQTVELEEKARLKPRQAWWRRLADRPAWLVTAAALFVVAVGALVWASGLFQPAAVPGIISASASVGRTLYSTSDPVVVTFVLKNTTDEPVYVGKLPPVWSVMDASTHRPVYTSSEGEQSVLLEPGESRTYAGTWWPHSEGVGSYYIELEDLTGREGQPIKLTLSKAVRFEVRE